MESDCLKDTKFLFGATAKKSWRWKVVMVVDNVNVLNDTELNT